MEIICEILRVIYEGSARPTQVMHKANLTWPVLTSHLEVLLRHQLLTREASETRTTYRLTAKGSAVLNIYLKLKEEVGPLEAETVSAQRLEERLEPQPALAPQEQTATLSAIRSALGAANFRLRDDPASGRSGARYRFSFLAEGLNRSSYGFDLLGYASEGAVISGFVKQLDSDIPVHIVYSKGTSEGAKMLAESYSVGLVPVRGLRAFVELLAFQDALLSKRGTLLEVDPSQGYEHAVRELVQDETKRSRVSAFTWRASPVFSSLPRNERVYVYVMTAAQGKAPSRPREFVVPSHDEAALLEFVGGSLEQDGGARNDLLIFDSVSELLVSLGNEKSQRFLRKAAHLLGSSDRRSLFIVKRGYHDERTMKMVKGIFPDRLVYDGSGLRLDHRA